MDAGIILPHALDRPIRHRGGRLVLYPHRPLARDLVSLAPAETAAAASRTIRFAAMSKIEFISDANAWHITLNDPPLHILDIAMLEELRDALGRVNNDRHCLIIGATGEKAFSAGASVQDHLGDRVATMLDRFHACFRILAKLDVITVALVKGAALGGGCELALACD